MARMDRGLRDLLTEMTQLITRALEEKMEDEKLREKLIDINQRMAESYGLVIGTLGLEITTMPAPGGEKRGKKPKLSLGFGFGSSEEDREMEEKFGLDGQEMNQLLEEARKERKGSDGEDNITKTASPPPEAKISDSYDLRNVSQIINSIRETARALNQRQRASLIDRVEKVGMLKGQSSVITPEQIGNDTAWLQGVQSIVNGVQNFVGRRVKDSGVREKFLKQTLSSLEKAFKDARML